MKKRQRKVVTVIPVKNLNDSKSRLSPIFTVFERKEFCLNMLKDVLNAIKCIPEIKQSVIISNDQEVLATSKKFNVEPLKEVGHGLNQAVLQGVNWCLRNEATSILILPIDIPLILPIDLSRILTCGRNKNVAMVISPSKSKKGTNALLLTPPDVIPPFYGLQSFQKHLSEASKRGIIFRCYASKRIALDIDTVDDLFAFILTNAKETSSYKFLDSIKLLHKISKRK